MPAYHAYGNDYRSKVAGMGLAARWSPRLMTDQDCIRTDAAKRQKTTGQRTRRIKQRRAIVQDATLPVELRQQAHGRLAELAEAGDE